jgi:hypothetical protein
VPQLNQSIGKGDENLNGEHGLSIVTQNNGECSAFAVIVRVFVYPLRQVGSCTAGMSDGQALVNGMF